VLTEREAAFVLACARGIGPAAAARLVARHGSYRAAVGAAAWDPGLPEAVRAAVSGDLKGGGFRAELARLRRARGRFAMRGDPDYPAVLGEIATPPIGLFVRGASLSTLSPAVAIVGTRAPTARGPGVARRLAAGLAAAGVTVVSGLARGIDTAAHLGALEAGGTTVAVMGTGLDRVYPPENEHLASAIVRQGALVTEFPMGSDPRASAFPRRNRIIAGLSAGVVVVEAGERSGALITAARALEQGREVFAVPGPIDEEQSRGPNGLLKDGATLVEDVVDILDELARPWGPLPAGRTEVAKRPEGAAASRAVRGCGGGSPGGVQGAVLACLSSTPASVDEIVARANVEPGEAVAALFELEMVGSARACPGGRYVLGRRDEAGRE
jgi:DNA processing protein